MKQRFLKWVEETHGEKLNPADVYEVESNDDSGKGKSVTIIELVEGDGKSFFKETSPGKFEYLG